MSDMIQPMQRKREREKEWERERGRERHLEFEGEGGLARNHASARKVGDERGMRRRRMRAEGSGRCHDGRMDKNNVS